MMNKPPTTMLLILAVSIMAALTGGHSTFAQWNQWGGPNRNFTVDTGGLADSWPDGGPKKLWQRSLGTGFAGMAVDNGVLYTMYRTAKDDKFEYTVAIDTATGKTLWEHKELAAVPESVADYGKKFSGPNATPLVLGDRVYTVGRNALLLCLNASDGKVLWKHSLHTEFGAQTHTCGFSSSPIAFGNTVILPIGRPDGEAHEGSSLIAFDQKTGEVVWKNHSFQSWHSSPILISRSGEQELVQCTTSSLVGVDPNNGSLRWKYDYPDLTLFEGVWAAPVWDGKDTIFFSSKKVGCAVRLTQEDSKTVASQLWLSRSAPFGMGTPLLVGDLLVGGKRGQNAAFIAVDTSNGRRKWFKRLFPGATILGDENKLIVLDSNGQLALVTATKKTLTVASQTQLTEQYSFTVPTLTGSTLFVRDEKNIMALDLSVEGNRIAG